MVSLEVVWAEKVEVVRAVLQVEAAQGERWAVFWAVSVVDTSQLLD
ncbi:hypothetical protein GF359_07900 [candidate division WOR-3 bacterium]|uniref:Uncharacterized protein n=1 Tax=candidate division WOR-3 bacterium TaxID=2052148 RepID=A0A9D5KA28_UNCW3|nr:hypothetical protein [candidate division WOR-3 bacterium]MBD3365123.1 hypothetical protein [candidate division WOR-3 bacterium]